MKVLVAARLFSGLADSVRTTEWAPSGVPAIYKLLEGLAADPEVDLTTVLTVKDPLGDWAAIRHSTEVSPIGRVEVLPWRPRRWLAAVGLDGIFREVWQLIVFLGLVLRTRPDVCYVTNANFILGAVCVRLRLAPVVIRFLGIHPVQKRLADHQRGAQFHLYQSRFAKAICSMDGSGGARYLPKLLHPDVPLAIELNGVDPVEPDPTRVAALRTLHQLDDKPVVLFVGRLEANKGVLEFVAAVNAVLQHKPDSLNAIVVGTGNQESVARTAAASDRIRFAGAVDHDDVAAYFSVARIYVSLNRFGSLSNANLEAAAAGLCMIVLSPDESDATDVESLDVFPAGSVLRLPRDRIIESLAEALTDLLDQPREIDRLAEMVKSIAAQRFWRWTSRIEDEIETIKCVARPAAR